MTREQLFLSELALIERVIAWVCARRCLRGAEAEDFGSTVKLRLIENDYEILGRFEGRSSLKTYMTVVVHRLYLDYQTQRFGKWRPSAEARRLGPVALRLEALLYRDGLTFEEASGVLRTMPDMGIVLMDIMLPELDGYDTMRAIRKIEKLKKLPIIAVTAKAMKGDREKTLQAGAWDYLAKPVDTDQMLSVMRAWLHP